MGDETKAMTMRTLIDFFEIQPRPLENYDSRTTLVDMVVTWEEPERGPELSAESLWLARGWCEEG
jgi:hypothetical protein